MLWDNVGYDEKEGATIQVQIKRLRKEIIKLADQIAIIGTGGVVYNDKEIRDLIAVLRIDVDALLSLTQRPFHIWSPTPIVDKKSSASFWYSFKGNVDQVASFTFRFSVNNNSFSGINSSVSLEFEIPPIVSSIPANQIFETSDPAEMYSILPILFGDNTKKIRGILSESVKFPLSFVVPVTNKNDSQEMTKHLSMSFKFIKEGALQFLIVEFNYPNGKITQGDTLALGDEIFTTIQFHCPDFIFRKIK